MLYRWLLYRLDVDVDAAITITITIMHWQASYMEVIDTFNIVVQVTRIIPAYSIACDIALATSSEVLASHRCHAAIVISIP
jgi:hypothetical protein